MPRPQRDLDPNGGPIVEFARDLRALRARAGTPKFTTMAHRTGRSKTALADAAGGQHLPRWETVEDFVRACDADPAPWYDRWLALRSGEGAPPAPPPPPQDVPEPGPLHPAPPSPPEPTPEVARCPRPPRARGHPAGRSGAVPVAPPRLLVAAAVLGVLAVGALGFLLGRVTVPAPPVVPQTVEAIVVQNKVALGPDRLEEDRTPAYLSTEALAYCASPSRSCKVPGTEHGLGSRRRRQLLDPGADDVELGPRRPDVPGEPLPSALRPLVPRLVPRRAHRLPLRGLRRPG